MNHILFATHFSRGSDRALDRAGLLAQRHEAQLTLLHVIDPSAAEQERMEQRERASARMRTARAHLLRRYQVVAAAVVRSGKVAHMIREVAKETNADLIVLGARHRRWLRDSILGATVERVLGTGGIPTLLVNTEAEAPYRRVSLALDASPASSRAVRIKEALLPDDDLRASVIHAYVPPYAGMLEYAGVNERAIMRYTLEWRRDVRSRIVAMLERAGANPNHYDIQLEGKEAPEGIVSAVKRNRPDLLVIGTRGQTWLRRLSLTSVASHVLREVECDVLVVPPTGRKGAVRGKSPGTRRRSVAQDPAAA
jgi:nucleotide-binding universal stress UspA family protein